MTKQATPQKPEIKRRDATGHLDPKYAADLLARAKETAETPDAPAFVSGKRSKDALAEELGEEFVRAATSGEDDEADRLDAEVAEDAGGPFVPSTGAVEFAAGTDASNPKTSKREPFPKT